jgi:tetratricopeptide (TPR) repeat protein
MAEVLNPQETSETVRSLAVLAATHGQVEDALALFRKAAELGPYDGAVWFESDLRYWPLYLTFRSGDSLTEERLDVADAEADTWFERRNLMGLRRDLLIRRGDLRRALDASHECDRMERDSGIETAPAATAYLLAVLGRTGEATLAVDEALDRLPRIEEETQPHYDLARALRELRRTPEAIVHAREAYRQAWGDGPPYSHHWNLLDAQALLASLGEPLPSLPNLDASTHQAPLEPEVRAFIAMNREDG